MASKKFNLTSFKCSSSEGLHRAFCTKCHWASQSRAAGGGRQSVACREAKKHTRSTGHETRVDITHQRGYRAYTP